MPETQYDVRAQLTMNASRAHGQVRALSGELRGLGEAIKGGTESAGGLLSQLVAVGTTYLGLRAVGGMFRELASGAIAYTGNLEKTKIGLTSIIQGVENTNWEDASKRAGAAFQKIRDMAIVSPATSEEMFGIFQGIVGPIEAAGFSMQKVLDITNETTLAASALNVNYEEAGRDITMMARGAAGMHVKLFALLHATGAIREDAEAWNKLSSSDRVVKLEAALQKFSQSGKAFGSSWAGVTSSFKDITDNFKAAGFSPIMVRIGKNLERFNGYMLEHRIQIEGFMRTVGTDVAMRLQALFDRAQKGFGFIVDHWGEIVSRFDLVVARVKEVTPLLLKAAATWQAVQLGRNLVGTGVGLAGTGVRAAELMQGLLGGAKTAGVAGAAPVAQAALLGSSPFGLMGGASGVAGATTSGPGALFGMMGGASGAGGAEGAAAAGAAAAGGAATAMIALAAVLAAVAAVVLAVQDQWAAMKVIFGDTMGGIVTELIALGQGVWKVIGPVLHIIGNLLLVQLSGAFLVLSVLFRGLLVVLTPVFELLGAITSSIWTMLKPAFDWLFGVIAKLAEFFNRVFGEVDSMRAERDKDKKADEQAKISARLRDQTGEETPDRWKPLMGPALFNKSEQEGMGGVDLNKLAKGRVNVNQDFRGSRINVRQDFKGNTDPDRVVTAMMRDLTRQAESRVSSGFAGALTR